MSYSRDSSQDLIYNEYSNTYELASKLYTITFNAIPEGCTIALSGGTVSGNTISGTYNTTISYTVSKTGFITQTGNMNLTHDDTVTIILSNTAGGSDKTGGGGGKPTYINIGTNTITRLFAFTGSFGTFYTLSENPSIQEPLYNNEGQKLNTYQIYGKKGSKIIIKRTSDNATSECSINTNSTIKEQNITSTIFYSNGGGGSGAKGEDWTTGKYQRRRKGGAGGGYYWLNPTDLTLNSITGRDAGTMLDSEYPGAFPNVYSGKGGASGIDNGATVKANQTARKSGPGASGNSSAINPNDDQDTAYYGSGGGGAGGDEDASGGKAGAGNSSYVSNTTGENGYNYHTTPTQPKIQKIGLNWNSYEKKYKREYNVSELGKGGKPYVDDVQSVQGNNGWIYIYKFEKEYQTFDMGRIGADPEAVSEIIDGTDGLSSSQTITRIINGMQSPNPDEEETSLSNSQPILDNINGDQIVYEEQWKSCGSVTDTNIEENIILGGI